MSRSTTRTTAGCSSASAAIRTGRFSSPGRADSGPTSDAAFDRGVVGTERFLEITHEGTDLRQHRPGLAVDRDDRGAADTVPVLQHLDEAAGPQFVLHVAR